MEQATAIAAALPVLQSSQMTEIADSISCGVCDEKFYHVSNFLKHKSSCVGEAEKPSEGKSIIFPKRFSLKILFNRKVYNKTDKFQIKSA